MIWAALVVGIIAIAIMSYLDEKRHRAEMERMREMSQRILKLEVEKQKTSKIDLSEIFDSLKLVRGEQDAIRKSMTEDREHYSKMTMRLIATFKPRELKKDKTA